MLDIFKLWKALCFLLCKVINNLDAMIHGKLPITPFQAVEKIRNWCAYQERSQFEVRAKLRAYGLDEENCEAIIADLIIDNFVNEERFSRAYVSGKLRIKLWGKNKIKAGLRQHRISETIIKDALQTIEENEYEAALKKVLSKKHNLLKGNNKIKVFYALLSYAVSRGFENDLAKDEINSILNENFTE
jgi:regulatory protein